MRPSTSVASLGRSLGEYLRWITATAIGWGLGVALPAVLSAALGGTGRVDLLAQLFMVPAVGAGLGLGQTFVLERHARDGAVWAVSSAASVPLGALGGIFLFADWLLPRGPVSDWLQDAAPALGIGLGCGLSQAVWLVHRGVGARLGLWWVVATLAGWTAAGLGLRSAGPDWSRTWLGIPRDSIDPAPPPPVPVPLLLAAWLVTGGALGAIVGAVSGIPLPAILGRLAEQRRRQSGRTA